MKFLIPLAMAAAAVATAAPAIAFDPEDLNKLKAGQACEKCDLRGVNLIGGKFPSVNLQRAILRDSELKEADFNLQVSLKHSFSLPLHVFDP